MENDQKHVPRLGFSARILRQEIITVDELHSPRGEFRQWCQVGSKAIECILGLFQDGHFAGKSCAFSVHVKRHAVCFSDTHLFHHFCANKKQTEVSHSSTEAEIRSLDVGLRMERAPAGIFM